MPARERRRLAVDVERARRPRARRRPRRSCGSGQARGPRGCSRRTASPSAQPRSGVASRRNCRAGRRCACLCLVDRDDRVGRAVRRQRVADEHRQHLEPVGVVDPPGRAAARRRPRSRAPSSTRSPPIAARAAAREDVEHLVVGARSRARPRRRRNAACAARTRRSRARRRRAATRPAVLPTARSRQSTYVNLPKAATIEHPIRRCGQQPRPRGVLSWATPKEGTEC